MRAPSASFIIDVSGKEVSVGFINCSCRCSFIISSTYWAAGAACSGSFKRVVASDSCISNDCSEYYCLSQ